jgi:MFS family permease
MRSVAGQVRGWLLSSPLGISADFRLFYLSRTLSALGSALTLFVLPLLIFVRTHSIELTALFTVVVVAPYLVFGLFAGSYADRHSRLRIMVTCDSVCAAAMTLTAVATSLGKGFVAVALPAALVSSSAAVWFDAASFGVLPKLVPSERIVPANSLIWGSANTAAVIAPAAGGLLLTVVPAGFIIGIDAVSFAVSALLLTQVRRSGQVEQPTPAPGTAEGSMAGHIVEGLRALWNMTVVRYITAVGAFNALAGGAWTGLVVVYAVRQLHVSQSGLQIGILFSAGSIGGVIATLVLPWLSRKIPLPMLTCLAVTFVAVVMLLLALSASYYLALVLAMLLEVAYIIVVINGISIRQMLVPAGLQSRVNTAARTLSYGATPVGAVLGGLLASATSVRTALLVMSVVGAVGALLAWFSPLRSAAAERSVSEPAHSH